MATARGVDPARVAARRDVLRARVPCGRDGLRTARLLDGVLRVSRRRWVHEHPTGVDELEQRQGQRVRVARRPDRGRPRHLRPARVRQRRRGSRCDACGAPVAARAAGGTARPPVARRGDPLAVSERRLRVAHGRCDGRGPSGRDRADRLRRPVLGGCACVPGTEASRGRAVARLPAVETRELRPGARDARGRRAAVLTCVDPGVLPIGYSGRAFDEALLRDLPASVDPCGERGEFHTFVWDAPGFSAPIDIELGESVVRDGFAVRDVVPAGPVARGPRRSRDGGLRPRLLGGALGASAP